MWLSLQTNLLCISCMAGAISEDQYCYKLVFIIRKDFEDTNPPISSDILGSLNSKSKPRHDIQAIAGWQRCWLLSRKAVCRKKTTAAWGPSPKRLSTPKRPSTIGRQDGTWQGSGGSDFGSERNSKNSRWAGQTRPASPMRVDLSFDEFLARQERFLQARVLALGLLTLCHLSNSFWRQFMSSCLGPVKSQSWHSVGHGTHEDLRPMQTLLDEVRAKGCCLRNTKLEFSQLPEQGPNLVQDKNGSLAYQRRVQSKPQSPSLSRGTQRLFEQGKMSKASSSVSFAKLGNLWILPGHRLVWLVHLPSLLPPWPGNSQYASLMLKI